MLSFRIKYLVILQILGLFTFGWGQFQPAYADHEMVVCAEPLAGQVGLQILEKGGNAVDAAIATGFALAVTYPSAGNIGGGGYMIIQPAGDSVMALDYREKAPLAAHRNMYLDDNGKVIPGASTVGYPAAGVPGTVAGFYEAHQRYGRLPWIELVKPAIDLARDGFRLDANAAEQLNDMQTLFSKFPSTAKIFIKPQGRFHQGDILRQTDLAATLSRIADRGRRGFYAGETARLIAEDMRENEGLISLKDLAEYQAEWTMPVRFSYRGYQIYSMPPSSSGGIVLNEILKTFEFERTGDMHRNQAAHIHLMCEIFKRGYADRSRWLGDARFFDVPVRFLTSHEHISSIYEELDRNTATPAREIISDYPQLREGDHTTHFCVVDRDGNAVSNTYTINSSFGALVVIEGCGFILNNEMDDFSIKPGFANSYGLIGGKANQIEPGKRMLSSMTPVIIRKNGRFYMAVGSPGGSTIITTVAQVVSNVIDFGLNIRQAIESPRFHHQWLPDTLFMENRIGEDTRDALRKMGYVIVNRKIIGKAQGILWDEKRQQLTGWSDPRGNGIAIGN